MAASVVVTKPDRSARVIPCPTVRHAQGEARGVVLDRSSDAESVTVCDAGREVERWVKDSRTGVWQHVAGRVLGSVW